nr:glutamate 5-kinase [Deltaproteobacteria bacterium]
MQPSTPRPLIANARRVVIKLGTRAVSDAAGGLDSERLAALVGVMAQLHDDGREVLLVSSGAVGLGAHQLEMALPVRSIVNRQAAAAVGQSQLMAMYADHFGA